MPIHLNCCINAACPITIMIMTMTVMSASLQHRPILLPAVAPATVPCLKWRKLARVCLPCLLRLRSLCLSSPISWLSACLAADSDREGGGKRGALSVRGAVKVFGEKTELLVDRARELDTLIRLGNLGLGPKVRGMKQAQHAVASDCARQGLRALCLAASCCPPCCLFCWGGGAQLGQAATQ